MLKPISALVGLTILLMSGPTLLALEGGSTSTSREWKSVTPHSPVDPATRKQELADREQAIKDEIAKLRARLKTTPSDAKMAELHENLKTIRDNYGWEPKQGVLYPKRSIEPMLKGQDTMPRNLLAAFKQLNEDLKARDIDLIIVPMVPSPHHAAHITVDGIEATNDYYPGWTKMMLEMLENDLEIVDTTTEFRKATEDEVLVTWAQDYHTGSRGREIAAKAVAQRLQRYDFARRLRDRTGKAEVTEVTHDKGINGGLILRDYGGYLKVSDWLRTQHPDKSGGEINQLVRKMKNRFPEGTGLTIVNTRKGQIAFNPKVPDDMVPTLHSKVFKYLRLKLPKDFERHTELVFIGDSQLHTAVYGSGFPIFLMNEVGGLFRWGSKSWSGFSPPEIYREVVPDSATQPRVVVLTFLPKYFWHSYHTRGDQKGKINEEANRYKPRPLPPLRIAGSDDEAILAAPFRATIKITAVSKQRDPKTLEYSEALTHSAAILTKGPKALIDKPIGVRYWTMVNHELIKQAGAVKPGDTLDVTLHGWAATIEKHPKMAQHQIFNDTDQDLIVPVFWIAAGPLGPSTLKATPNK